LHNERCKIIVGDLSDEKIGSDFLKDASVLIHLAQNVNPKINTGSWKDACKNSCDSTFVLLDLLRKHTSPLHIIYPSSGGTVYSTEDSEKKIPFREDLTTRPVSPYGIQKIMFENHFSLLSTINSNISVNILRISNPYGTVISVSRAQGFIGIAMSKIRNKEEIEIWGDINSTRDYIHQDDLNRAFEAATNYKNGFQIFNIGSGEGTSLKQIIDLFSLYIGEKFTYKIINPQSENYFPSWNVLDIAKAKMVLNWQPSINIEEGIKNAVKDI